MFKKLSNFFKYVLAYKESDTLVNVEDIATLEKNIQDLERIKKDNDMIMYNQTVLSKLYSFEQTLAILEENYKNEYSAFMCEIENIRKEYIDALNNSEKQLTFEIDPDLDYKMMTKVIRLEDRIKAFMQQQVKYDSIIKKTKKLIVKLNILYNATIFVDEQEKVESQIENAIEAEKTIITELKKCDYILNNKMLKESLVNLIFYIDYLILKISIRNNNCINANMTERLAISTDFNNINFYSIFKDFILDEITDLNDLLHLLENNSCSFVMKKKIDKLLEKISYIQEESYFYDINIWNEFFELESTLLDFIKTNTNNEAKIKILDKMNIDIDEKEIFVSPKTKTLLCLSTLYLDVNNESIALAIKFINILNDSITYKEIYFILLLFNILDDVVSEENDLLKSINKYIVKYAYSNEELKQKKQEVKKSVKKEYIPIFVIKDYDLNIITRTIDKINLDYKIEKGILFLNVFYFNDLVNVKSSLVANAKNINLYGGIVNE